MQTRRLRKTDLEERNDLCRVIFPFDSYKTITSLFSGDTKTTTNELDRNNNRHAIHIGHSLDALKTNLQTGGVRIMPT